MPSMQTDVKRRLTKNGALFAKIRKEKELSFPQHSQHTQQANQVSHTHKDFILPTQNQINFTIN